MRLSVSAGMAAAGDSAAVDLKANKKAESGPGGRSPLF
jgi:hypothetical protein